MLNFKSKGNLHKFFQLKLGGGGRSYIKTLPKKTLPKKLLAISLCAALVLCTVPLRGGSYVSEADTGDASSGTVLTLSHAWDTGDVHGATASAQWTSFDLFTAPRIDTYVCDDGVWTGLGDFPFLVRADRDDGLFVALLGSLAALNRDEVVSPSVEFVEPCVGCWAAVGSFSAGYPSAGASFASFTVPTLGAGVLADFGRVVIRPRASAEWSPSVDGRTVAHCDECVVRLQPVAGAPVTVAGNETDGWTITRTAGGDTTLDLLIGDFKVGELTVTEPLTLDAKVQTKFGEQTVRVVDINNVLPAGTQLHAETVETHKGIDNTHQIEHVFSYQITLLDANGVPLKGQLDAPVELYFEVLKGMDAKELEVVLVNSGVDREFIETIVDDVDGSSWVKVTTDHFSPYALIDTLSAEEKAALNAQTGDMAAQTAVAGLGIVLVLALGIMLRLLKRPKNS